MQELGLDVIKMMSMKVTNKILFIFFLLCRDVVQHKLENLGQVIIFSKLHVPWFFFSVFCVLLLK